MSKSRVHRVTIDETGVHVREPDYPEYDPHHRIAEALRNGAHDAVLKVAFASQITAAANEHGFYGEDADRFVSAHDNATEYLIGRVSASGGDKRRWRDRRSRARLTEECLRQAGVPSQYMPSLWNTLKAIVGIAAPPPWNIVIAAVMVAVERYLGGGT